MNKKWVSSFGVLSSIGIVTTPLVAVISCGSSSAADPLPKQQNDQVAQATTDNLNKSNKSSKTKESMPPVDATVPVPIDDLGILNVVDGSAASSMFYVTATDDSSVTVRAVITVGQSLFAVEKETTFTINSFGQTFSDQEKVDAAAANFNGISQTSLADKTVSELGLSVGTVVTADVLGYTPPTVSQGAAVDSYTVKSLDSDNGQLVVTAELSLGAATKVIAKKDVIIQGYSNPDQTAVNTATAALAATVRVKPTTMKISDLKIYSNQSTTNPDDVGYDLPTLPDGVSVYSIFIPYTGIDFGAEIVTINVTLIKGNAISTTAKEVKITDYVAETDQELVDFLTKNIPNPATVLTATKTVLDLNANEGDVIDGAPLTGIWTFPQAASVYLKQVQIIKIDPINNTLVLDAWLHKGDIISTTPKRITVSGFANATDDQKALYDFSKTIKGKSPYTTASGTTYDKVPAAGSTATQADLGITLDPTPTGVTIDSITVANKPTYVDTTTQVTLTVVLKKGTTTRSMTIIVSGYSPASTDGDVT